MKHQPDIPRHSGPCDRPDILQARQIRKWSALVRWKKGAVAMTLFVRTISACPVGALGLVASGRNAANPRQERATYCGVDMRG